MLLPSAIPCDVRRSSRFAPSRLFTTPPPSDRGYPSGNGLLGTCRALQSLLNGSPAPSPRRTPKPQRLQSPLPITQARRSPRTRKTARPASPQPTPPPTKLASTPPPPPSAPARGANKRRRTEWQDDDSDADFGRPISTPKRRRHVPYELPLGLSSTDFYSLHSPPFTQSPPSPAGRQMVPRVQEPAPVTSIDPDSVLPSIEKPDEPSAAFLNDWTAEEDQRLIEVVLEKFRLSQQEWDECARQVGHRNCVDVGRRWHSLVEEGRVSLRRQ
ncbi:uncharacterized protein N7482_002630 [Penicillium canariense]|uniref:Myb-like domain-containing protein n=1 Tax=Penicillium canariense TaxID=189055 RepID=A0A9W9IFL4_9EURO|nr:uncharacterized protein N7482_002630 [Penicillium canariense]KAJ5176753.1 hypothetical protein N7482_002630 [Penicillium canariense]